MRTEFTYYIYYLKEDEEETYKIYAYTDEKNVMKEFDFTRDIENIFIKKKKKLNRNEVNILARDYQTNIIHLYEVKAYNYNKKEFETLILPMTHIENITLENMKSNLMLTQIYQSCWLNPNVFKKDIQRVLKILRYKSLYNSITRGLEDCNENDENTNIKPDELGIFLHYFGYTMRKKGFDT